jgi:hypothetical protein
MSALLPYLELNDGLLTDELVEGVLLGAEHDGGGVFAKRGRQR